MMNRLVRRCRAIVSRSSCEIDGTDCKSVPATRYNRAVAGLCVTMILLCSCGHEPAMLEGTWTVEKVGLNVPGEPDGWLLELMSEEIEGSTLQFTQSNRNPNTGRVKIMPFLGLKYKHNCEWEMVGDSLLFDNCVITGHFEEFKINELTDDKLWLSRDGEIMGTHVFTTLDLVRSEE